MKPLELVKISKSFGNKNTPIIEDISFFLEEGEFVTLLGPSGCGKTTILRIIAGLEIPDNGDIYLSEKQICGGNIFVPPHLRNIGMVFQNYALFPHLTVKENILFSVKDKTIKTSIFNEIIKEINLVGLEHRYPSQLSGGEQQRVALGRALAQKPSIILLDEPFSSLDAQLKLSMRDELKEIIQKAGISAIFVTHDQSDALAMSSKIIVLNKGHIQQIGTPKQIYFQPINEFVSTFIGEANVLIGSVIDDNTINSDIGIIAIKNTLKKGEKAQFILRPTDFIISTDTLGVKVLVKTVSFYGSILKVKVCLYDKPTFEYIVYTDAKDNIIVNDISFISTKQGSGHLL
jgi:iron(III) transport system ATP-binding protein